MKPWSVHNLRRLFDESLDALALEFYGISEFKRLPRREKVLKMAKADIANRHSYEWMMRGVA